MAVVRLSVLLLLLLLLAVFCQGGSVLRQHRSQWWSENNRDPMEKVEQSIRDVSNPITDQILHGNDGYYDKKKLVAPQAWYAVNNQNVEHVNSWEPIDVVHKCDRLMLDSRGPFDQQCLNEEWSFNGCMPEGTEAPQQAAAKGRYNGMTWKKVRETMYSIGKQARTKKPDAMQKCGGTGGVQ